jgi:hypothetical protein
MGMFDDFMGETATKESVAITPKLAAKPTAQAKAGMFDDFMVDKQAEATSQPEASGNLATDIPKGVARGLAGLPDAIASTAQTALGGYAKVADLAFGNDNAGQGGAIENAVNSGVGIVRDYTTRPLATMAENAMPYSESTQAAQGKLGTDLKAITGDDAKGWGQKAGEAFKATIENPRGTLPSLVESIPQFVAGSVLLKGAKVAEGLAGVGKASALADEAAAASRLATSKLAEGSAKSARLIDEANAASSKGSRLLDEGLATQATKQAEKADGLIAKSAEAEKWGAESSARYTTKAEELTAKATKAAKYQDQAIMGLGNATLEGAGASKAAHDEILGTDPAILRNNPVFVQLEAEKTAEFNGDKAAGLAEAVRITAEQAGNTAYAPAALLGAGASLVTGGGLEGQILNRLTGKAKTDAIGEGIGATTKALAKGFGEGALKEGAEETMQGASGQFAQNLAMQPYTGVDLSSGIAEQAASGAAMGILSGGVGSSAGRAYDKVAKPSLEDEQKLQGAERARVADEKQAHINLLEQAKANASGLSAAAIQGQIQQATEDRDNHLKTPPSEFAKLQQGVQLGSGFDPLATPAAQPIDGYNNPIQEAQPITPFKQLTPDIHAQVSNTLDLANQAINNTKIGGDVNFKPKDTTAIRTAADNLGIDLFNIDGTEKHPAQLVKESSSRLADYNLANIKPDVIANAQQVIDAIDFTTPLTTLETNSLNKVTNDLGGIAPKDIQATIDRHKALKGQNATPAPTNNISPDGNGRDAITSTDTNALNADGAAIAGSGNNAAIRANDADTTTESKIAGDRANTTPQWIAKQVNEDVIKNPDNFGNKEFKTAQEASDFAAKHELINHAPAQDGYGKFELHSKSHIEANSKANENSDIPDALKPSSKYHGGMRSLVNDLNPDGGKLVKGTNGLTRTPYTNSTFAPWFSNGKFKVGENKHPETVARIKQAVDRHEGLLPKSTDKKQADKDKAILQKLTEILNESERDGSIEPKDTRSDEIKSAHNVIDAIEKKRRDKIPFDSMDTESIIIASENIGLDSNIPIGELYDKLIEDAGYKPQNGESTDTTEKTTTEEVNATTKPAETSNQPENPSSETSANSGEPSVSEGDAVTAQEVSSNSEDAVDESAVQASNEQVSPQDGWDKKLGLYIDANRSNDSSSRRTAKAAKVGVTGRDIQSNKQRVDLPTFSEQESIASLNFDQQKLKDAEHILESVADAALLRRQAMLDEIALTQELERLAETDSRIKIENNKNGSVKYTVFDDDGKKVSSFTRSPDKDNLDREAIVERDKLRQQLVDIGAGKFEVKNLTLHVQPLDATSVNEMRDTAIAKAKIGTIQQKAKEAADAHKAVLFFDKVIHNLKAVLYALFKAINASTANRSMDNDNVREYKFRNSDNTVMFTLQKGKSEFVPSSNNSDIKGANPREKLKNIALRERIKADIDRIEKESARRQLQGKIEAATSSANKVVVIDGAVQGMLGIDNKLLQALFQEQKANSFTNNFKGFEAAQVSWQLPTVSGQQNPDLDIYQSVQARKAQDARWINQQDDQNKPRSQPDTVTPEVKPKPNKPSGESDKAQANEYDYAHDFSSYTTIVISEIYERGDIKKLFSNAGVKKADSFYGLPLSEQAKAYAKYVADGNAPVEVPDDYNAWVQKGYDEIEIRQKQSQDTITQANGKPFKTEKSAAEVQKRFDLEVTHDIKKVDGGFALEMSGMARQDDKFEAKHGLKTNSELEDEAINELGFSGIALEDLTDSQWDEINAILDNKLFDKRNQKRVLKGQEPYVRNKQDTKLKPSGQPTKQSKGDGGANDGDKPLTAKEQAQKKFNDALNKTFNVLDDIAIGKMNAVPAQYTIHDLQPAITRLMSAAIELGYISFKENAIFVMNAIKGGTSEDKVALIKLTHLQGAFLATSEDGKSAIADISNFETLEDLLAEPKAEAKPAKSPRKKLPKEQAAKAKDTLGKSGVTGDLFAFAESVIIPVTNSGMVTPEALHETPADELTDSEAETYFDNLAADIIVQAEAEGIPNVDTEEEARIIETLAENVPAGAIAEAEARNQTATQKPTHTIDDDGTPVFWNEDDNAWEDINDSTNQYYESDGVTAIKGDSNLVEKDQIKGDSKQSESTKQNLHTLISSGNVNAVLDHIKANDTTGLLGLMAGRLKPILPEKLQLEVVDSLPSLSNPEVEAGGRYTKSDNTVRIKLSRFKDNAILEMAFIHELIHAATVGKIANIKNGKAEDKRAYLELKSILDAAKKADTDSVHTGKLKSVEELIAYGLSDSDFQSFLAGIKHGKGENKWTGFVRAISRLVGVAPEQESALSALLMVGDSLLRDSIKSQTEDLSEFEKQSKVTLQFKQILKIKRDNPNSIVVVRMGDFQESFFSDADKVAELTGATAVTRENGVRLAGWNVFNFDEKLPLLTAKYNVVMAKSVHGNIQVDRVIDKAVGKLGDSLLANEQGGVSGINSSENNTKGGVDDSSLIKGLNLDKKTVSQLDDMYLEMNSESKRLADIINSEAHSEKYKSHYSPTHEKHHALSNKIAFLSDYIEKRKSESTPSTDTQVGDEATYIRPSKEDDDELNRLAQKGAILSELPDGLRAIYTELDDKVRSKAGHEGAGYENLSDLPDWYHKLFTNTLKHNSEQGTLGYESEAKQQDDQAILANIAKYGRKDKSSQDLARDFNNKYGKKAFNELIDKANAPTALNFFTEISNKGNKPKDRQKIIDALDHPDKDRLIMINERYFDIIGELEKKGVEINGVKSEFSKENC